MRYYSCSSFSWCAIFYLASLLHFQVTNCHRTSGYSHESEISGENSKWMSSLPDNVPLSSLSLPGTHESLSRGHGGAIAECQTLSLESQLRAGIRVLDVRCRHIEDSFAIHHGMIFLHIMFGDVLQQLEAFLKNNPSETILMRVKEEYEAVNVTGTFEETFSHYYNENPTLFWHTDNETGERPDPTLRSVRGKVVILDNFSSTTKYGLNYGDSGQFIIQDDFKFSTNWDLYDKWMKVKDQVRNADVSRRSGENKFFLNYLSGSFGSFPYFVASGHVTSGTGEHRLSTGLTTLTARDKYPDFPRLDCILKVCTISFEGTNVLLMQFLQERTDMKFVGIIMADFPGDGLISTIISLNNRKLEASPSLWTILFIVLSITVFSLTLIFVLIKAFKIRKNRNNLSEAGISTQFNVNIVTARLNECDMKYQRF